jgi:hypothetical protein
MEYSEANSFFIDSYKEKGFELVSVDEADNLIFVYKDRKFIVNKKDIINYSKLHDTFLEYQKIPNECSVCSSNYREQMIDFLDPFRIRYPTFRRELDVLFGTKGDTEIYASIGSASPFFNNYFRFNDFFFENMRMYRFSGDDNETCIDMQRVYQNNFRCLTIKIFNINEKTINNALKKSTKIIEDCLFQISYLKNMTLWLAEDFPKRGIERKKQFNFYDAFPGWSFSIPSQFNSDLIRFYQSAKSSNVPELQFLNYYHILEYFFISTSNEKLYEKLSIKMQDPRFKINESYLDQIVQEVKSHNKTNDELEMLKNVFKKYVDEDKIKQFIGSYETFLDNKIYTKKHDVFGVDVTISMNDVHFLGSLAKHIKETRNAIVHSSDRYERNERHLPFTKTTEKIVLDIPLLKYLAERVMIASAVPRQ